MSARRRILELVTDPTTGQLSRTRVWGNLGSCIASWVFVYLAYADKMTEGYFALYLAGIVGDAAISKYLAMKNPGADKGGTQ